MDGNTELLLDVVKSLGPLSDAQLAACDDSCLRRYLRARQGNVQKAARLLHATLKWREDIKIDTLQQEEFQAEIKSGKMYVAGNDRAGHSVLVTRKKSDAFQQGQYEQYLRHLVFTLETTVRSMKNGQEKWVWIMDMAGYSRANSPPLNVSMATLRILADHYPERLHRCYMVDAPAVFSILFTALSPFIDSVTKKKIVFISSKTLPQAMPPAAPAADGPAGEDATGSIAAVASSSEAPGGQRPAGAAAAAAEEAHEAGGLESFIAEYLAFYREPYDEAKFRTLLGAVGW